MRYRYILSYPHGTGLTYQASQMLEEMLEEATGSSNDAQDPNTVYDSDKSSHPCSKKL